MKFWTVGKWFKSAKQKMRRASASLESLEARAMLAGDFVSVSTFGFPEAFVTATAITSDSSGNQYVVGTFNGRIDLDFGTKHLFLDNDSNNQNGFVAKYSASNKLIWAHQFGNSDVNDTANLVKEIGRAHV